MRVWESIPDTSVCRTVQAPVSQAPCEVMCPESLLAAPMCSTSPRFWLYIWQMASYGLSFGYCEWQPHHKENLHQITGVIHFNASDQDSIQETTRQMKYMKGVYKSIKTRHPMRKSKKMPWGDLKILNQAKTLVKQQGYNNAYPQK
ncbi:MAPK-interacting and spindle-stabilizing protein-like isoform X2 [Peromyscus maniculatus bairdii]|uniref:MAPK-interacting and spindle-stabilizing protein-like isoform X2 n=1 Tax=Peromyscus maniculatus bairdii TaxID=230844 RepID=UPI003FD218DF